MRWTLGVGGEAQREQVLEEPDGNIKYLARYSFVLKRLDRVGGVYVLDLDASFSPEASTANGFKFTHWRVAFLQDENGAPLKF